MKRIINFNSIAFAFCFLLIGVGSLVSQASDIQRVKFGNQASGTSNTYVLSGKIIDESTAEGIIGAVVNISNLSIGDVSDENGDYSVKLIRGKSTLEISYLGYNTRLIEIEIYKDTDFDVQLQSLSVELGQVIIQGQSEAENIESVISGVERLNIEELSQRTQLLGELDVLRSIQSLSGVTSVGDGASGFNVRGGNADENLILQDDALILNPSHTLGFFSLFHPDMINSVELYKGNQPSYYGGRLSSVLQVGLREGNQEKYEFNGGVGMAASRLTFEGPIQKGKSSFIAGGRVSYMDYLLNFVKNINVKRSKTFFYDLTLKADARISDKTKIGISSFIAGDDFQFGEEVNFDYNTKTATAYINHLFNDRWNLRGVFNIGDYESSLFDIQGNDLSRFTNGVKYIRGSVRNFVDISDKIDFIGGLEYNHYTVRPGRLDPEGPESTAVPQQLENEQGLAITPFAQLEIELAPSLNLFGAIRYTKYSLLGPGQLTLYSEGEPRTLSSITEVRNIPDGTIVSYTGWEPRASLNYKINDRNAFKLGYNRGYQYLNQLSNTASATPVDIWKLSDSYVQPQLADNFNVGWFSNFRENKYSTSLEVFYRDQKTIVEYRDFADLLLNENLEQEVVEGVGRSYGVELNVKKNSGDFKYELNYTYSRSERRVEATSVQRSVNAGEWYPSNYDKPHSLNLNISKNLGPTTNISFNFTYSTGRPITAPVGNFAVDNILNVPIFSQRNQFRIPDYHRLDVAYKIGPFGKGDSENSLTISVYNLYSRKNAYSVFFRQLPFQSLSTLRIATLGSIFPAVTYNFKFK